METRLIDCIPGNENKLGSFLHEHVPEGLIKNTRSVTATVVHSHRN